MVLGVAGRDTVRDELAREQIVGTPDSAIPGQQVDTGSEAKDPKTGEPLAHPARDIWISSTAFQSALNTAYFAENVATFAIAMGAALLLVGIGFLVLTVRLLRPDPATAPTVRTGERAVAAS